MLLSFTSQCPGPGSSYNLLPPALTPRPPAPAAAPRRGLPCSPSRPCILVLYLSVCSLDPCTLSPSRPLPPHRQTVGSIKAGSTSVLFSLSRPSGI